MSDISDTSLPLLKQLSNLSNQHPDLTVPQLAVTVPQLAVDLSALSFVPSDLTITPVARKNTLQKLQSDCQTKVANLMKEMVTPESLFELKYAPSSSDSLPHQEGTVSVDPTEVSTFLKQIPNKKLDNFSIPEGRSNQGAFCSNDCKWFLLLFTTNY